MSGRRRRVGRGVVVREIEGAPYGVGSASDRMRQADTEPVAVWLLLCPSERGGITQTGGLITSRANYEAVSRRSA